MILARIAARSVRRRPGQALLIGIAVVIATAFAATALTLALNARVALVGFGMSTPETVDAVVIPPRDLDGAQVRDTADDIRALPNAGEVVVEYLGDIEVEAHGTTATWKLTSDPGSGPLSAVSEITAGSAPGAGELFVGPRTAARSGVAVGDVLAVGALTLTVGGIGPINEFGQDVALIHEEDAAALGDAMMTVRILATGDIDVDAVAALVDDDATVLAGDEARAAEVRTVTDSSVGVFGALVVFVGLAVISALVIVGSTFRILLGRRAAELALLRTVGATSVQVRRLVLSEAAAIGLIGGVVGAAIGFAGSAALVEIARSAGLVDAPFVSSPIGLAANVALAILGSVVAALPAAREASRASPVQSLTNARSSESRPVRLGARLALAGVLSFTAVAAAAGGTLIARTDEFMGLGLAALSGILLFVALVAVGPFLIRSAARLMRPAAVRSAPIRLALANARRASRRTASMTTVLTLGVGLTAALTVGVAGATEDARLDLERNFPTEALVLTSDVSDPESFAQELAAHPAIEARVGETEILIDPAAGSSLESLRTAVQGAVDVGTVVYWASDVREGIEQVILIGQVVGSSMIGVTLFVALIGVLVTLALSVAERRQELALLRALGLSRSASRRSIAAEAALAALVGAVLGTLVGVVYGLLALRVLGMAAGSPPIIALAALVVGVVVAALLAATIPMRTASRVPPAIGLAAR